MSWSEHHSLNFLTSSRYRLLKTFSLGVEFPFSCFIRFVIRINNIVKWTKSTYCAYAVYFAFCHGRTLKLPLQSDRILFNVSAICAASVGVRSLRTITEQERVTNMTFLLRCGLFTLFFIALNIYWAWITSFWHFLYTIHHRESFSCRIILCINTWCLPCIITETAYLIFATKTRFVNAIDLTPERYTLTRFPLLVIHRHFLALRKSDLHFSEHHTASLCADMNVLPQQRHLHSNFGW